MGFSCLCGVTVLITELGLIGKGVFLIWNPPKAPSNECGWYISMVGVGAGGIVSQMTT